MASINYGAREISVKIVYYGPGLSGKTTNLQIIHRKLPNEHRSDMVSLATETDRTLFFDFLPVDLGTIKGFSTKFQLYTVPGQVYYNATRKLVLRGVDGVVFVADSAADKIPENLESFQNLEDNLAEYHYKREEIPIIIQYNKRDLPNALSIDDLQKQVNKYDVPWTEAVASKGVGVFDSLKLIGKIVIDGLNRKYSRLSRQPGAPASAPAAAQPAAPSAAMRPAPPPQAAVRPIAPVAPRPAAPMSAPRPAAPMAPRPAAPIAPRPAAPTAPRPAAPTAPRPAAPAPQQYAAPAPGMVRPPLRQAPPPIRQAPPAPMPEPEPDPVPEVMEEPMMAQIDAPAEQYADPAPEVQIEEITPPVAEEAPEEPPAEQPHAPKQGHLPDFKELQQQQKKPGLFGRMFGKS